ncbi:hypothetical protein [Thiothrix winogradskyi]|uniref:Uncharacterized protein n=1 Tax=Thiothrix winogradskyi TaxID=96472 RepID=A0ABY3SXP8_9GAMM|nr:hypothetical protein [Thiothrix winogradskyi]UJS23588.1 hypothetical protein L2Y54_16835 [Thiothrix winogradskyi]
MNKVWFMGGSLILSFITGLYVFFPNQHGKLLPDFTAVRIDPISPPIFSSLELEKGQSVLGEAGKVKPEQRAADGRVIVSEILPPEVQQLNDGLTQMTQDLQKQAQTLEKSDSFSKQDEAENLIQQTDKLIAELSDKHSIKNLVVLSENTDITDPELKQVKENIDIVQKSIQYLSQPIQ